ncbi:MAG: lipoyl synthase [Candidatus Anammoxibacter sp.]
MKVKTKPQWLKTRIPSGKNYLKIKRLIERQGIHTICHEARCPNTAECSEKGVATFLLLGNSCSRGCLYCNVKSRALEKIDSSESIKVAGAVKTLQLNYVVITSVTRDDLTDGGAGVFVDTINRIKSVIPTCKTEVLVPDFKGESKSVKKIINARPSVFAHNLETTENMFETLRPQGDFKTSLRVLRTAKEFDPKQRTKSGIMVGFGETKRQVVNVMEDLRENGVDIFTIGQYLQPSKKHYPVKKYYTPDEFREFDYIGRKLGFSLVKSGPLVRSSYMAGEQEVINSEQLVVKSNFRI